MFILLRAERIERFGYRDRRVFQIVSTSSPHNKTAYLISGGEDSMKVLGSLASKVLRPGEQKAYVTGGIIRIGSVGITGVIACNWVGCIRCGCDV
jgi:hypothetical protein